MHCREQFIKCSMVQSTHYVLLPHFCVILKLYVVALISIKHFPYLLYTLVYCSIKLHTTGGGAVGVAVVLVNTSLNHDNIIKT